MTQRQYELLRLLKAAAAPLTSAALAEQLGISARTVMKDVAALNGAQEIICSSQQGYWLNRLVADDRIEKVAPDGAYTRRERIIYICRRILLSHQDKQEIFRLADALHVSPESIKKDMGELQGKLLGTSLSLHTSGGCLLLKGHEEDKRNLLGETITETLDPGRFSLKGLQQVFPDFPVRQLYESLWEGSQEQGLVVNDNLWPHLLQDVLTAVSRIRLGHLVSIGENESVSAAVAAMGQRIAELCVLSLPRAEYHHLKGIFYSYWLPQDFRQLSFRDFLARVPAEMNALIVASFAWLERELPFLPRNDRFRVRLAMNLHTMFQRKKLGRRNINLQTEAMKQTAPFAFCLAMDFCRELARLLDRNFSEEDAAFLAVHLGLALDGESAAEQEKVTCGLFIPFYYDYDYELKEKLMRHFQRDLHVLVDIHGEEELQQLQGVSLVISTLPMPAFFSGDWVVANPLLTPQNIREIRCHIEGQKRENRRRFLAAFLRDYGELAPALSADEQAENWILFRHVALQLSMAPAMDKSRLRFYPAPGRTRLQGQRIAVFCRLQLCPWEWQQVSCGLEILLAALLALPRLSWGGLKNMEDLLLLLERAENMGTKQNY
ncbi:MAG: HTH domain-containing protein [Selenomonas sp.]|uniref:BglG family transcription antiterminator n=1 Tax=Selenomonas sp. TaxID=2053611 RepID=UPI0025E437D8|nr:HTH domain-containing protein [Selenomonas sp.]MCR5758403.1 HTH domain-containing protein [Selenomonas sp.]